MDFISVLSLAKEMNACGVHFSAAEYPHFRGAGPVVTRKSETSVTTDDDLEAILNAVLSPQRRKQLEEEWEHDCTFIVPNQGRYRVHVSRQKDKWDVVFRLLPANVPTVDELHLPEIVKRMAEEYRSGLLLVSGQTGSGKSTTLAGIIEYMNQHVDGLVITSIEDPREFFIPSNQCLIKQKTIGVDVKSYSRAVSASLREDVNVLVVGEARDAETVHECLHASSSYLVITSVHGTCSRDAINSLIYAVPAQQQEEIRFTLANNLKAILCQRLLHTSNEAKYGQLWPATEILINTGLVADYIRNHQEDKLEDYIRQHGAAAGMATLRDAVYQLYSRDIITPQEAINKAPSPSDMRKLLDGLMLGQETVLESEACEELQ